MICYYVRIAPQDVGQLAGEPDIIFDPKRLPPEAETIDIDKAYDGLARLASETKRAESAHTARLIRQPDWPGDEARASVEQLNTMPIDDALAAIEGRASEQVEGLDFGLGAAAYFPPQRARILSEAISALTEARLRDQLDFEIMDRDLVQPDNWIEEGEDLFQTYLMPARDRLQAFYAKAAEHEQAVLVIWS